MNFSHFMAAAAAALSICGSACAQGASHQGPHIPQAAVSWNAADLLETGMISLGVSMPLSQHFSAILDAKCSPWTRNSYGSVSCYNLDTILQGGIRWWPWHVNSGMWVSGALKWKTLRSMPRGTREWICSDSCGTVCTIGYAWMLGTHLNLNAGVGAGVGRNAGERPLSWRQMAIGGTGRWFLEYAEPVLALTFVF